MEVGLLRCGRSRVLRVGQGRSSTARQHRADRRAGMGRARREKRDSVSAVPRTAESRRDPLIHPLEGCETASKTEERTLDAHSWANALSAGLSGRDPAVSSQDANDDRAEQLPGRCGSGRSTASRCSVEPFACACSWHGSACSSSALLETSGGGIPPMPLSALAGGGAGACAGAGEYESLGRRTLRSQVRGRRDEGQGGSGSLPRGPGQPGGTREPIRSDPTSLQQEPHDCLGYRVVLSEHGFEDCRTGKVSDPTVPARKGEASLRVPRPLGNARSTESMAHGGRGRSDALDVHGTSGRSG